MFVPGICFCIQNFIYRNCDSNNVHSQGLNLQITKKLVMTYYIQRRKTKCRTFEEKGPTTLIPGVFYVQIILFDKLPLDFSSLFL